MLIDRMRPLRGPHPGPELRYRQLRKILLDHEEAGVDAHLLRSPSEVVVVGDVKLVIRAPYRGNRVAEEELLLLVLLQGLEPGALVVDLDQADRDLRGAQAVKLDFVQLRHQLPRSHDRNIRPRGTNPLPARTNPQPSASNPRAPGCLIRKQGQAGRTP